MAELTGRAAGISQGQGRLDAHVQRRAWLLRRPRHRRRAGRARHRPRLQAQICRRWRRVPGLFRRRRGQPGPGLRELQHGRAVEAADHLRDREQPICDGHQRRALVSRGRSLQARRELPHSRASRSTAWTCSRCAARPRRRSNGPAAARGRSCSSSRPIAIAAIRCPTRPNIARARKCRLCASIRPDRPCRQGAREARRRARTSSRRSTRRSRTSSSKLPKFAEEAPEPEPAELYTDVLVESY